MELQLLDNPRRRRRRSRRRSTMSPAKRAEFARRMKAARRKRNAGKAVRPAVIHSFINPRKGSPMHRRRKSSHRRRFRHNPPGLRGITSGLGGKISATLFGAAGIAGTAIITNAVVGAAKLDASYKPLVKAGVALFGLPLIAGMIKSPQLGQASIAAAANAVYEYAKTIPTIGQYLAGDGGTSDLSPVVQYNPPALPPARFV